MSKRLDGQLEFDLFDTHTQRAPTWDDLHDGQAHLVERIEPCDGDACIFWRCGCCSHTVDNYAFPKYRDGGMCSKRYIVWNE